ncbi:MAG TPA: hypothetical protein PLI43_15870 [Albidovulum sp.]|uniref:hypothetical protein n=1 Tax=Albidovulum sp. TaxID=1872424 RepID=UPI002C0FE694|nr:hypothetical protein [Albidovulum sp.]
MPNDTSPLMGDIGACLDEVRECLGGGNLAGLGALAARLDDLTQALSRDGHEIAPDALKAMKSLAERQLALLGAAREGVLSAQRRVALLHSVCGELSTYDRDGQGRTLRFGTQNLEQRA